MRKRSGPRLAVVTLLVLVAVLCTASAAFAWGEVLFPASSWSGVDVYNNGPYWGDYSDGDSGYGYRWQRVALAQRLTAQKGWVGATHWPALFAYQMYDVAPSYGLQVQANGSCSPTWGDLVIYGSSLGGWGHVAAVIGADATHVFTVEQNWSTNGRASLNRSGGFIDDPRAPGTIRGIIKGRGTPPTPARARLVAFVRKGAVWTTEADGSAQHRLWQGKRATASSPSWSPDGKLIAACVTPSGQRAIGEIRIISLNGVTKKVVASTRLGVGRARVTSVAWSPDGTRLAFTTVAIPSDSSSGTVRIAVYTLATGKAKVLWKLTGWLGASAVLRVHWSSDSKTLLFVQGAGADGDARWVSELDAASASQPVTWGELVPPPADYYSAPRPQDAAWSPDGARIALATYTREPGPGRTTAVIVANADGTGWRACVTESSDLGIISHAAWSGDGNWIAYEWTKRVPEIWTVAGGSSQKQRLATNAGDPAWQP